MKCVIKGDSKKIVAWGVAELRLENYFGHIWKGADTIWNEYVDTQGTDNSW